MLNDKTNLNYSLLGGDLGCTLFLLRYYRLFNKDKTNIAFDYIHRIIKESVPFYNTGSYCNGLSGLGIALMIINQEETIANIEDILSVIDTRLTPLLKEDLQNDNVDFLHGFIGIGFYFYYRCVLNKKKNFIPIKNIINYLNCHYVACENGLSWINTKFDRYKFNISLSHGCSSILILLSKIYKLYIWKTDENRIIEKLMLECTKFILRNRLNPDNFGSYFPIWPIAEAYPHKSRLAWCYGDLGIGIALLRVADILDLKEIRNFAFDVFKFSTRRRNLFANGILDASLCHGSTGVAIVFNQLYSEFHSKIFQEAFCFWDKTTLSMRRSLDGQMTFPYYTAGESNNYRIEYGILEGISGVGLYLMGDFKLLAKLLIID